MIDKMGIPDAMLMSGNAYTEIRSIAVAEGSLASAVKRLMLPSCGKDRAPKSPTKKYMMAAIETDGHTTLKKIFFSSKTNAFLQPQPFQKKEKSNVAQTKRKVKIENRSESKTPPKKNPNGRMPPNLFTFEVARFSLTQLGTVVMKAKFSIMELRTFP